MRYTPLLESQDRGEMPQRGGELYAEVGKGHYVYTAYAWFRQLPAGVPGAYRQFANLISLAKAPRVHGGSHDPPAYILEPTHQNIDQADSSEVGRVVRPGVLSTCPLIG